MDFASALLSIERGHKIKRHHWEGYWELDNDTKEIYMYTYDGKVTNLRDTENILYTLENIACNDWEICDNHHARIELSIDNSKKINNKKYRVKFKVKDKWIMGDDVYTSEAAAKSYINILKEKYEYFDYINLITDEDIN